MPDVDASQSHNASLTGTGNLAAPSDAPLGPDTDARAPNVSPAHAEVTSAWSEVAQPTPPTETPAEIWARMMASETHEDMADVAAALAQSGDREKLLTLFAAIESTEDAEDRDTLSRSLQALHNPEFGPDLLEFLTRNVKDVMIADQARDALARNIAPSDIALLGQAIPADTEEDPLLRSYLVQTIARINSFDAVDALAELCWDTPHEDVHTAAAQALGSIGTPEAVNALIAFIEHLGLEDINSPIAQSLMNSANKDARQLLQEEFLTSTNPVIRHATATALAHLQNQETASANPPPGP